ncbi:MAG: DMT family transporter [Patescibacteria group bacterium]
MPARKRKKTSSRWKSYSWLLLNTVVWGAAFIAVKPALSVTTPTRYLLYRYILASLISLPIIWHYLSKIKEKKIKINKILLPLIGIELLGTTLVLWLIYTGLARTTAIEANLLTLSSPIFVTLGGILFFKEKEEKHEWLGLFIALFGTALLVLVPVILNGGIMPSGISLTGNILILAAMLINAAYYLLAKQYYKNYPKFLITTLSFYVGLISFSLLALYESCIDASLCISSLVQNMQTDLSHPSVWIAAGYMATFGSIIGLTAYYKGQNDIEASEASLFTYLQPIVAMPLGIILLNEKVYSLQLLALALIIFGVVIAERRKK